MKVQFLKQAFTSHDVVMKGNKSFSITLLSSVIIGLLYWECYYTYFQQVYLMVILLILQQLS